MFSSSIQSKINKIKLNVDNYLSQRKKDPPVSQPVPSVRRPQQNTNIPVPSVLPQTISSSNPQPSTSSVSTPQYKSTGQIQVRHLSFQNKLYQKPPLYLKNILKQKSITIFYTQQAIKYKLQIRAIQNSIQLKINQQKSSVQISFKKAVKYKFFNLEKGQPKWMLTTEIKDEKITMIINKQGKTIKNYFQGIVPEQCIKLDLGLDNKIDDKSVIGQGIQREQIQDTDDIINFAMPTAQQLADTQKFRKAIKDMKQQQKIMILMDIFKIKKQYDQNVSIDRKKLKCPIHACQKTYREISQLKTHLKKHPQLNKHGIQFTQFGTFEYSNKAMDLALYLGKLFPSELKKIIKKMKTKQVMQ